MPSLEASLRNLEKARANWSHPPRPWRSRQETRIIKRLVWQWFKSQEPQKWSLRAVARWLGVTHTYAQKLIQRFSREPGEMQREEWLRGPATFEHLERAREETRKERAYGRLREPPMRKWASFKIGDQTVRHCVLTKAEQGRRAAEGSGRPLGPTYVPPEELPLWAKGSPYYSPQNPCDPFVGIKRTIEGSRIPRLRPARFHRRWRPGVPWHL